MEEELAAAGVEALTDFIRELGLPTTLRELGADETTNLREIAKSCDLGSGGCRKMTHEEIFTIFKECY